MTDLLIAALALMGSLVGILICWKAWLRGAPAYGLAVAALPWSVGTAVWIWRYGAEIGIPLALETAALVAFAFILSRVERRPVLATRERTAPPPPPRDYRRGTARLLSGGLLGFAAAMGLALPFATLAPLGESTRIILAALAVPSLWCAAIAWTACGRNLLLQSLVYAMVGVTGIGLAFAAG